MAKRPEARNRQTLGYRKPLQRAVSRLSRCLLRACDSAQTMLTTADPPLDLRSHPQTRLLLDEPSPRQGGGIQASRGLDRRGALRLDGCLLVTARNSPLPSPRPGRSPRRCGSRTRGDARRAGQARPTRRRNRPAQITSRPRTARVAHPAIPPSRPSLAAACPRAGVIVHLTRWRSSNHRPSSRHAEILLQGSVPATTLELAPEHSSWDSSRVALGAGSRASNAPPVHIATG